MPTAHQQWGSEDFNEEEYELIKTSRTSRIIRITIAIIAIIGILQLSGLYQYSFFTKTPQQLAQKPLESQIDKQLITVPLSIYIVKSETPLNSSRTQENARDIVVDAANIWKQAGINLEIKSTEEVQLTLVDTLALYAYPRQLIKNYESEKDNTIKVFFTRTLSGLNGIAYGKSNTVTIADYTANPDFRVLAHEIGHILGLDHTGNTNALMSKGSSSTNLSLEEIEIARETANKLFGKERPL